MINKLFVYYFYFVNKITFTPFASFIWFGKKYTSIYSQPSGTGEPGLGLIASEEATNHNGIAKRINRSPSSTRRRGSQSVTQGHRQRGGCNPGKAVRTLEYGGERRGWAADSCENEVIALFNTDLFLNIII